MRTLSFKVLAPFVLCTLRELSEQAATGYRVTKWSFLFFVPLTVVGILFLMSLIIATFEESYDLKKGRLLEENSANKRIQVFPLAIVVPFVHLC